MSAHESSITSADAHLCPHRCYWTPSLWVQLRIRKQWTFRFCVHYTSMRENIERVIQSQSLFAQFKFIQSSATKSVKRIACPWRPAPFRCHHACQEKSRPRSGHHHDRDIVFSTGDKEGSRQQGIVIVGIFHVSLCPPQSAHFACVEVRVFRDQKMHPSPKVAVRMRTH